MIPLRLTLSNFMSYGAEPTELDLRGQHVVCLSGDNGNGKSAVLDAMTYALWGYTRASGSQASSEDDLIRLGADHLEVDLEFKIDDNIYRSVRRRSRGGKGSEWHLFMPDGDDVWRPVGGNGVRETQKTLIRILRMEYPTFLNSAYIQQGRADEFTHQRPEARKKILADILDLSRFDELEQMAREERDDAVRLLRDTEAELRYLEQQAEHEPTLREELAAQQAECQARDAAYGACEHAVAERRSTVAALAAKVDQCRQAEARLARDEQLLRETQAERKQTASRCSEYEALLAAAPQIEEDWKSLTDARKRSQALEDAVTELALAERDCAAVKGDLEKRRQQRIADLRMAEAALHRAEEEAARAVSLAEQRTDLDRKLQELGAVDDRHNITAAALQEELERFASLKADAERVKQQLDEQHDVLDLLAEPRAACPVCGSGLDGGRRERVVAAQKARLAELQAELERVNEQGRSSRARRKELEAEEARLAKLCASAIELRARLTDVMQRQDGCSDAEAGLASARRNVDDIRHSLDAGDFGAEERKTLAAIQARIAELTPAAAECRRAVQVARDMVERGTEKRLARLEQARREHGRTVGDIERLDVRIAEVSAAIEAERVALSALREGMRAHTEAQAALASAESELAAAARQRDESHGAVARTEQAIQACADARTQTKTKRVERKAAASRQQVYSDLAVAFGKRGVQALIIENALPEIQEEANRLLARLSDNAMQVFLTTLRRARSSGGAVETLDITITDDAGTRPYEMYSGGEAFRVNFALRIALSRLLARRAGARLQTLIIDEGFGTQDARGIERLVAAINAIQDEFALILVISHVESLKDAFSSRIEIVKTPSGSQISYLD